LPEAESKSYFQGNSFQNKEIIGGMAQDPPNSRALLSDCPNLLEGSKFFSES